MKSSESIDISRRFFEVQKLLITRDDIKSVRAFCRDFSINPGTYYLLKDKSENNQVPLSALVKMIKESKVSAHWLMTGEGDMFSSK